MTKSRLKNFLSDAVRNSYLLIWFTLVFFGCTPQETADKPPRYNVLFVAIDDLRPELGVYGNQEVKTPTINKIAARGTVFHRAYCQQAVCGPSRLSILTGTHPDRFGIYGMAHHLEWRETRKGLTSLPEQFKKHGYYTYNVGKMYDPRLGNDNAASWSEPFVHPGGQRYALEENQQIAARRNELRQQGVKTPIPAAEAPDVPDTAYTDGMAAMKAIEFLQARADNDQPFFLALGFSKPHLPFAVPKKYWDLYDSAQLSRSPYPTPPKDLTPYTLSPYKEIFDYTVEAPVSAAVARQLVHGYYASVSYVDAQLKKVYDALEQSGTLENTIVVIWGDHGFKLGDYGEWAKATNLELDARVPLIISLPGSATRGQATNSLVELVDVFPTLCEAVGIPIPPSVEGVSMMPILKNPTQETRSFALTQYPRDGVMGYSIRTKDWRYTEWIGRQTNEIRDRELYNLRNTPIELENVLAKNRVVAQAHAHLLHNYLNQAIRWQ